jgi:protein involved in polysaccharide export with SLBB domain
MKSKQKSAVQAAIAGAVLLIGSAIASAQDRPATQGAPQASYTNDNYRLAPNDTVRIVVFREDDLATTARIDKTGTISFPLIGTVKLAGLTLQGAAKTIEKMLGADYLVNPQVFVSMTEYSKRRFTILGQVSRPGIYEMPDETSLTLLEAIGMAGGFTRIAAPTRVTVKRTVNGEEIVYKLDAKAMSKDDSTKPFNILPGDTITIGESII